jgi:hypothetical protein
MKKQATIFKTAKNDKIDKRDLVNIDLYSNEIATMGTQLEEAAMRQPKSHAVDKKLAQLRCELSTQKENLERFKESCAVIPNTFVSFRCNSAVEMEGFFDRLKAFEAIFKNTRNNVNDFLFTFGQRKNIGVSSQ